MTTYYDPAFAVRGVGARTDPAGTAVTDMSAEEDRLSETLLTAGVVAPDDGFVVRPVTGAMQVTVGSGSARVDEAVVAGTQAGQTPYRVRLDDVDVTVTVDPADASQDRVDSVFLYVADAAYDAGTLSLPRIAYRPGTPGGAAPGPEAAWTAYLRLADVTVPAGATNVDGGVADRRVHAHLLGTPAGVMLPYAGASVPEGFLLADGAAVSRTQYARLFAVLGTTYGAGDGSSTFNLPDSRDRVLVGAGGKYARGATFGADDVTLTTAQMPGHDHTATVDPVAAHAHDVGLDTNVGTGTGNAARGNGTFSANGSTSSAGGHTHAATIGNTGGGGSHENRQPSLAVNAIIAV